ncbi:hypothetical protein FGD73_22450, partial [Escherichia coli]
PNLSHTSLSQMLYPSFCFFPSFPLPLSVFFFFAFSPFPSFFLSFRFPLFSFPSSLSFFLRSSLFPPPSPPPFSSLPSPPSSSPPSPSPFSPLPGLSLLLSNPANLHNALVTSG